MGDAQQSWTQIVAQKRHARDQLLAPCLGNMLGEGEGNRLPRVHQVEKRSSLDRDNDKITDIDNIGVLSQQIARGELTAEQVVKSYIRR